MWIPRCHLLLFAVSISTAADMPKGIFHGTMVSFEGSANTGVLLARNAAGDVYGCGYDSNSYFEDDHHKTSPAKLDPGDPLEILTDHKPGSRICYIRMAQVVQPPPPRSPRREVAAPAKPVVAVLLKGDRTVSGLVVRLDGGAVTLRTRTGEETLLLRADTLYQCNGLRTDAATLAVNDRVSVREGRNADGQDVAYQVVWGDILDVP
jgi:hypothetical protein